MKAHPNAQVMVVRYVRPAWSSRLQKEMEMLHFETRQSTPANQRASTLLLLLSSSSNSIYESKRDADSFFRRSGMQMDKQSAVDGWTDKVTGRGSWRASIGRVAARGGHRFAPALMLPARLHCHCRPCLQEA